MKRFNLVLISMFLMFGLTMACESDEDTTAHDSTEAEHVEQALWSYPHQGELVDGETFASTLSSGDFGHYWTFEAQAGQVVDFAVEWTLPSSRSLGAVIRIKDGQGWNTLAEHATLFSNQAHLSHTFEQNGSYRVYVKHYGYALFGSYPYVVGADPALCATWSGSYEDSTFGTIGFFAAGNYPGSNINPWSNESNFDETYTVTEHNVYFGTCTELQNDNCGDQGPEVIYTEFPLGASAVVPNLCHAKNHVYDVAGDDGWMVWWDYCSNHPGACD